MNVFLSTKTATKSKQKRENTVGKRETKKFVHKIPQALCARHTQLYASMDSTGKTDQNKKF